jgi:Ca2+-binding EF-hand superfamily protein
MKPKYTLLLAICFSSLVTSAANAQDGERKGPARASGEGGAARMGEMVKKADTNADGKISKEEFLAASATEANERFSKLDANADGSVDEAEIREIASRLREGMANRGGAGGGESSGGFRRPPEGDGDRPKGEGPPRGERPEGGRPEGGPPQGGPGGNPGMMGINPEEAFSRMDKNADGSLDMPEFIEAQKAEVEGRFKRMDENGDGKVSKDEMKGAMEKLRSMMQRGGQGRGPGGPGGPSGGEGGFRRPPSGAEGGAGRPRPESEGDAPKKAGGV